MSDHYFAAEPSAAYRRTRVFVRAWGHELELESATGVFSNRRLDPGTAVLFRSAAPAAGAATVLDLGCGYGPIACALAKALPEAQVWAVDVNARARRLAEGNASRLSFSDRVHVCSPDEVPDDLRFDEIWSNPPIRVGKPALHALLQRWLARLAPSGRALLVVGKHLGADSLQRWLVDEGYSCTRLASAKGFRAFEARR